MTDTHTADDPGTAAAGRGSSRERGKVHLRHRAFVLDRVASPRAAAGDGAGRTPDPPVPAARYRSARMAQYRRRQQLEGTDGATGAVVGAKRAVSRRKARVRGRR